MGDSSEKSYIFFIRTTCGIFLTSVTLVGIVPADIAIGIKYKDILGDSDVSCSIRTAFAMFIIATCIEGYLLIWQILAVVCAAETDGCCTMDCYCVEVALHFTSFGNLAVGVIIFATKNSPNVWYWYFALTACLSSMVDAIMWVTVQNIKRLRQRMQNRGVIFIKFCPFIGRPVPLFIRSRLHSETAESKEEKASGGL